MTLNKTGGAALLAINGLLVGSAAVFAQTAPDSGALMRELEQQPVTIQTQDTKAIELPRNAPEATPAAGGLAIKVERFTVTGAQAFDASELEALVADLAGQDLTLAELHQATARITNHYRAQGYFLSRAYLPEQDVSQGAITIAVLEGRLGQVKLNNRTRVRDSLVQRPLQTFKPGQMLKAEDFETPLLQLSDVIGLSASSRLAPGETLGTSDLVVDLTSTPLVSGSLELDNFGNKYTGEARLGGSLRFNNALGLGDRLDLRAMGSDESHEFYRVQYALPLGPWATELGAAYSDMDYQLAEEFAELDATGNAQITSAFLRQSLVRTRRFNAEIQLQYDGKDLEDKIAAFGSLSEKASDLYTLTLTGDMRDNLGGGGFTRASLAFTQGHLDINSYLDRVIDSVTAKTAGDFTRWTPSLMRLQNLGGNWSLHAQIHGQFTNKNLDSSEKLSIGGNYGVRAYAQGEASGDQGWMSNIELRYNLSPDWQIYGLLDHGEIKRNKKPWATTDNQRSLSGTGLGLRWNHGGLHINATLATPIGSEKSAIDDRDPRAWGQVVWAF